MSMGFVPGLSLLQGISAPAMDEQLRGNTYTRGLPGFLNQDDQLLVDDRRIIESHERCIGHKLDQRMDAFVIDLTPTDLTEFLGRHRELVVHAKRIFTEAHRCLSDQGLMFVLTDSQGRTIEIYSHTDVLRSLMEGYGLRPGVLVAEENSGSSAIALALRYGELVAMRGSQHYCHMFQSWTCVAAPVVDARGEIRGCVNVSAPYLTTLGEKLALAKLMAKELGRLFDVRSCLLADGIGGAHPDTISTPALTAKQREVLTLFADGKGYKEIAKQLGLNSTKTVEEHLDAIRKKLAVSNRRECIRKAVELNLL